MSATDSTTERAWEKRFLKLYAETGNVTLACKGCRVNRTLPYWTARHHPDFAEAWKVAEEEAVDALEAEARRRAMDSSDRLLEVMLKAGRPEKYRDRHLVEVLKRYEEMSDDELNQLLARRLGEIAALGEGSPPESAAAEGEGE